MAVLAVSVVLIARERDRAEASEARAKANEARARDNLALAHQVVNDFGTGLSQDPLLEGDRNQRIRRTVPTNALPGP